MKKILVATDGSEYSDKAIDKAIEMARNNQVEILVVNIAEDYCPIGLTEIDCDTIRELVMKESKGIMQKATNRFKDAGFDVRGLIEFGSPAETIAQIAQREKADEIIVASHGKHGAKKFLMGSVTARLIEVAPCPVIVVK
ncbi:MAG: universal stress protein [Thermodesulfovibrionales bacterium]|nr:universal stress protein [Thermodesulfovibrionales bacterium]